MQSNPKDPMNAVNDDRARQILQEVGKHLDNVPNDVVMLVAYNMLLNAVRQKHSRRQGALADFDEMTAKFRHLLAEKHYSVSGKRLNIFPFHQKIELPHFDARVKLN